MNFIIENIDQGHRHLIEQIRRDNMTDRKSKKLKHNKVNYESDRCYRSLRQFEGKTIIMYDSTRLLIPTNARKRIANELVGVGRKKLFNLSKRKTKASSAKDEGDTSVRRSTANERAWLRSL